MKILVLLLFFTIVLSGCIGFYTSISDIKEHPNEYEGKEVSVKGRVIETFSVPFVRKGMFQIEDKTGKIWVISGNRMPTRGDDIKVKGKVKTGFTISGKTYGTVVVEGKEEG
ncbi:hypothetical protein GF312_06845 [Candidatus Poribacteria bacterium]|nr:hypothetical protein [Candidatus Poribacteria bacterium]